MELKERRQCEALRKKTVWSSKKEGSVERLERRQSEAHRNKTLWSSQKEVSVEECFAECKIGNEELYNTRSEVESGDNGILDVKCDELFTSYQSSDLCSHLDGFWICDPFCTETFET